MSPRLLLGLGLALAGCAAPVALDAPADHPARLDAPTAAHAVEVAALPPVAPPTLPAVLRPDGRPPAGSTAGRDPMAHGMDHGATEDRPAMTMEADDASMTHTAMNHGVTALETPSPTPDVRLGDDAAMPALSDALDATLAVHDALASDRLDPEAARVLEQSIVTLTDGMPEADPHYWHTRSPEVATLHQSAEALARATDLAAARAAFGTLSALLADALETLGMPASLDLVLHTCGMTDAPQGGVWLQRAGPVRNPYFGTSMLLCSRRVDEVPSVDPGARDHGSMNHEGTR